MAVLPNDPAEILAIKNRHLKKTLNKSSGKGRIPHRCWNHSIVRRFLIPSILHEAYYDCRDDNGGNLRNAIKDWCHEHHKMIPTEPEITTAIGYCQAQDAKALRDALAAE